MKYQKLLAEISRRFLEEHNIYRYRMKKVFEMNDDEVITCCHWYCESNGLISEWNKYRDNIEAQYCYCSYLEQFIEEGLFYDIQMIKDGYINKSSLPEITIDKEKCSAHCSGCKYAL